VDGAYVRRISHYLSVMGSWDNQYQHLCHIKGSNSDVSSNLS